jgi:hypothetical protein
MATTQQRLTKWSNRISESWQDEDGVWIALRRGWQDSTNPSCHTIHEDTWQLALDLVSMSVPCACGDCCAQHRSIKQLVKEGN